MEPEPLEDLHLRYHQRVFEVVVGAAEGRHGYVSEFALVGRGRPYCQCVRGALEEEVVDVDEIAHADGTFFQLGGEV